MTPAAAPDTSPVEDPSRGGGVREGRRLRPRPRWFDPKQLVHLIYLGNLIWQPAFNPTATWGAWALVVGLSVAYVPVFVVSHHPRMRVRQGAAAVTVVMGAVGTLFNVGASTLLVYAAITAAWAEGRRAMRWLVLTTVVLTGVTVVSLVPWPYRLLGVLPGYLFIWVLGLQTMSEAARERETDRLRIENVRIEQLSAAAERERIARDMHDVLGHSLTGLVVRAQLVQSLLDTDATRAREHATELEVTARQALAQLRATVAGLNQVSLSDEIDTARRTLAAAGLTVAITTHDGADPDPIVGRTLALALREAVTNTVRHAQAQHCTITLGRDGHVWRLDVIDDGIGSAGAREGNGLRGMRERITALAGDLQRTAPAHGRGTHLGVSVPM